MIDTQKILANFYGMVEKIFREYELIAGKSGRHMIYPYTISAKIAQFPYFYYMKNNFIWMYYPLGMAVSLVVFIKIHNVVNSPEYKRDWAEKQRLIAEKENQHH